MAGHYGTRSIKEHNLWSQMGDPGTYILDINEVELSDRERVGAKATRLGTLARAGVPVPRGFCITTQAFVDSGFASLTEDILAGEVDVERRANRIRQRFESHDLPTDLSAEIASAYDVLGAPPVAVRSSALAEDTSQFSFAGQYESFLQVTGRKELLLAVKRCWASCWSPRAVRYHQHLPAQSSARVSMAVLVQTMVPARAAGVLFTVNPVTSDPDEIVINASPGLGEAIVAGLVTPDTYVLDKRTLRLRERRIGDKGEMVVAEKEGIRRAPVPACERRKSTLTRRQCAALGRLGIRIEQCFGAPQDIEYVHDGHNFWIVQSRPVTGLSSWPKPRKGAAWSRHSFIEFMPRPLSPLFETTYLPVMDEFLRELAGEHGLVFRGPEPVVASLNGYAFIRLDIRVSFLWPFRSAGAALRFLSNLWGNRWRRTLLGPYEDTVSRWQDVDVRRASWEMLWRGVVEICQANAYYWRACIQNRVCGPIERTFAWLYRHFVERHDRPPVSVFLRGHDSEPVRAERALFQLAQEFRDDAEIERAVAASPTEQLTACLEGGERGQRFLSLFRAYLRCYGHQFFTLDFKEPTLGEQPAPLLETVKSFLTRPTGACHRSVLFREERDRAEAQLRRTLDSVRWTLLRWILRLLDCALVLREDVLFFLGLGWPTVRRFILELGRRTAQNGWIETDEDVFFLTQTELQEILAKVASPDHAEDLQRKIRERRNRWDDQAKLKPPVLIPGNFRKWGMRISSWMPEIAHANTGRQIRGVAVSRGMATGPAVVIMSHEGFHKMKAGCVLVAPMTTPAWTPLFNLAKAVVTDVGGLLSHTSIVAREYGIPAVIGTGVATQRIADGQIVTVDGDRGRIVLEHD